MSEPAKSPPDPRQDPGITMLFCCDRKNVFPVDAHPINKTCRKLIRILEKNGGEEARRPSET